MDDSKVAQRVERTAEKWVALSVVWKVVQKAVQKVDWMADNLDCWTVVG